MEAVRRAFNNWSVIQTTTLKLVTTFSCHGEYQTGLCLRVRERHKSHSPAIKAARLETRECAGYIFLSRLCSLLTLLLCPFSLPSFQFISPYYLPKGKMDSLPFWYETATQVSLCRSVLQCEPYFYTLLRPSFSLLHWHIFISFSIFLYFSLSFFLSLPSSLSE